MSGLKGLFFQDEPVVNASPKPAQAIKSVVVETVTRPVPPVNASAPSMDSIMRRVIPQNGALMGFMASMDSLAQFIPDENTRTKAVLATLSGQGISQPAIASQIDTVLGSLHNEEERFAQAKQQRIQSEVSAKLTAADAVKAECEELSTQLGHKEAEESLLRREATNNQSKIDSASEEFGSAINAIKTKIEAIRSRI